MDGKAVFSRRSLLKGAAALTACAGVGGISLRANNAFAEEADEAAQAAHAQAPHAKQYGFLVDTDRCVACESCVAACREANGTPEGVPSRRKVVKYRTASGDLVNISTGCMHCENPACMTVCPAGAISKGEGGVVAVDGDRCIGCKYCYQACPFGVPHYADWGMDKCDCCLGVGVPLGATPNCVNACKFRALHYGPLDELLEASGGHATQIQCSTGPSYLLQ